MRKQQKMETKRREKNEELQKASAYQNVATVINDNSSSADELTPESSIVNKDFAETNDSQAHSHCPSKKTGYTLPLPHKLLQAIHGLFH